MDDVQQEINQIMRSTFISLSDKKLEHYQYLSEKFKDLNKGIQAACLKPYNNPDNRTCKLTKEQVEQIRKRYVPNQYGKAKLAREFGVSKSVIYRIIKGISWRSNI
jgi:DNA invertase Pin-like site-specific DNA recombinase